MQGKSLENYPKFFIVYSPGSGGNFLDSIFRYYAGISNLMPIDPVHGGVDKNYDYNITSQHLSLQQLIESKSSNPTTLMIAIHFEPSQLEMIAKMHYAKYDHNWLQLPGSRQHAQQQWPNRFDRLFSSNATIREQEWIDLLKVGLNHWVDTFDSKNYHSVFMLDTLLGKDNTDLNARIADILKCDPKPEVESYIHQWQQLASKYI